MDLHWHKPGVISYIQTSKWNSTNKSEFEFELVYICFLLFCNDRRYASVCSIPTIGYYILLSIFTLISFQTGVWSTVHTRYRTSVRLVLSTNSLHTCFSYCGNCTPFCNISTFHCLQKVIQWCMLQRTILQRTVFINKIRMLQRTQMLQQTRRNTIGRRSTRMRMTFQAFPL
jgi:hypothetical protein